MACAHHLDYFMQIIMQDTHNLWKLLKKAETIHCCSTVKADSGN